MVWFLARPQRAEAGFVARAELGVVKAPLLGSTHVCAPRLVQIGLLSGPRVRWTRRSLGTFYENPQI